MRLCNPRRDTSFDRSYHCDVSQRCEMYGRNPNAGVNAFDDLGLASITVFQAITAEGWVDIQYFLMDSVGEWTGTLFMLFVMLGGSLLLMNVTLAVVYTCYNEQREVILQRHLEQIYLAIEEEQERDREVRQTAKGLKSFSQMMDHLDVVKKLTAEEEATQKQVQSP
jgi:hypothetical protein